MSIRRKRAGRKSWETRNEFANNLQNFATAIANKEWKFGAETTDKMMIERCEKATGKVEQITFDAAWKDLYDWLNRAFFNVSELGYTDMLTEMFLQGSEIHTGKAIYRLYLETAAVEETENPITAGAHILVNNSPAQILIRKNEQTWHTVSEIMSVSGNTATILCRDGRIVKSSDVLIVARKSKTQTLLICLNDREREFKAGVERGADENIEIYADFETDNFVAVNKSSGSEYKMMILQNGGKVFGNCECKDFEHRSRICKHLSSFLNFAFGETFKKLKSGQVGRSLEVAA